MHNAPVLQWNWAASLTTIPAGVHSLKITEWHKLPLAQCMFLRQHRWLTTITTQYRTNDKMQSMTNKAGIVTQRLVQVIGQLVYVVTSSNTDRFLKSFHRHTHSKSAKDWSQKISPHLKWFSTLPCEILMPVSLNIYFLYHLYLFIVIIILCMWRDR